jgi:formate--tetrahydrofolate ligase
MGNLLRHIDIIKNTYHLPLVVTLNEYITDSRAEVELVSRLVKAEGVEFAINSAWEKGSSGAMDLADKVRALCEKDNSKFSFAYESNESVEDKILHIAKRVYGAKGVVLSDLAKEKIKNINDLKMSHYPVVIAKTQYSLSDDAKLIGAPTDFDITIRDIEIRSGAEFLVAIAGNMMLMPGLSKKPAATNMKINSRGKISGLF